MLLHRSSTGGGLRRLRVVLISALLGAGMFASASPAAACDPDCPWIGFTDIRAGSRGSQPAEFALFRYGEPDFDVYYSADDGKSGRELWRNGSRLRNINPGSASSNPRAVTAVGRKVFFTANDGTHGRELWVTDGTRAGTRLVRDIRAGAKGSAPLELTQVGKTLFFTANDGKRGRELWKSDGTSAGTRLVKEVNRGVAGAFTGANGGLTRYAGKLYFAPEVMRHDFVYSSLWVSDGTAAGTKEFHGVLNPQELTRSGGRLFMRSGDELWRTDGTTAGTRNLGAVAPSDLADIGGRLYFSGTGGLWKSDGTVASTTLVKSFSPTQQIGDLTDFDGAAVFTVNEDIWLSDGTAVGTERIVDAPSGSVTTELTRVAWAVFYVLDGRLHYVAIDLWCRDNPTECGDLSWHFSAEWAPELPLTKVRNLVGTGSWAVGYLFFSATDGSHGQEPWWTTTGD